MFLQIFSTVYKRKEAKIAISFCLFPFLLIISSLLPTNFMQISGAEGVVCFLEFFFTIVGVQYQLILPSVAFMYLAVCAVRDEIKEGYLFLYKDIPREKVFALKTLSLISWYFLYLIATFITTAIVYYTFVIHQAYSSGTFFPIDGIDYGEIITFIGVVITFAMSILLVSVLSIFLNNSIALILGVLFVLFNQIAPYLENVNWIFITGYSGVVKNWGFGKILLIILGLTLIYSFAIIMLGKHKLKRIEY